MSIVIFTGANPRLGSFVVKNSLSTGGYLVAPNGIGKFGILSTINSVSEQVQGVLTNNIKIVGTPVQGVLTNHISIDPITSVSGVLTCLTQLGTSALIKYTYQNPTWVVELDGQDITRRVTRVVIGRSEDSIFDTVRIESSDEWLYRNSNPSSGWGNRLIYVRIGSEIFKFYFEDRDGIDRRFSLWGRSIAAIDDAPFSEKSYYTMSDINPLRETARWLLSSILTSSITFDIDDHPISVNFEFDGYPIEAAQRIAKISGAILRNTSTGGILCRDRIPERPYYLQRETAACNYNDSNIIEGLSYRVERGSGCDELVVKGRSPEVIIPDLVVSTNAPRQGSPLEIEAYWNGIPPPENAISGFTTNGTINEYPVNRTKNVIREVVEIKNGVGYTSKPIYDVYSARIMGYKLDGETVVWNQYSKKITTSKIVEGEGIDSPSYGYRAVMISYRSLYRWIKISSSNVAALIYYLYFNQSDRDPSVRVKFFNGGNLMDTITEPFLIDKYTARKRATAELDKNKYNKEIFSFSAPYSSYAVDGAVIKINSSVLGLNCKAHITKSDIVLEGPKKLNIIEAVRWIL